MRVNFMKGGASLRSSGLSGRERVLIVALLLGPTAVAGAWGVLMPAGGPTNAYAGVDPLATTPTEAGARRATDEEKDATRYCADLCADMPEFASPTLIPAMGEGEDSPALVEEEEATAHPPSVGSASIMRDASGAPALYLDGRLIGEGDELHDGWVVETIDLGARTITIAHPEVDGPVTLAPGR